MPDLSTRHDPAQGWVYIPEGRIWNNRTTGEVEQYNRHGHLIDRWTAPGFQSPDLPHPGDVGVLPTDYQNIIPGANENVPRIGDGNFNQFMFGAPPSPYLTGNFPDYGELTAWGNSMAGWPAQSGGGAPSVGGNMQLGGFGGTPPATGFDGSLGQPMAPYSGPFGGWDYFGGGPASVGGNAIQNFGGDMSPGPAVSPFQDLWTSINYGVQGSPSQGGNAIPGFGGNMSPGPAVSPFQDLWSPINWGAPGSASAGGNMQLGGFGGTGVSDPGYSPGPPIPSFEDLWSAPNFGNAGSASVGGTDISGAQPNWSGNLFDPNIYAGGGGSDAISTFGGLNDPGSFDISGGNSLGYSPSPGLNYYSMPDGSRMVYDSDWNYLGTQTQQQGGGSGAAGAHSPILDLTGIAQQNLSLRPPSDPLFNLGPAGSVYGYNAGGQTIYNGGGGFAYSPTGVYGSSGQYMGANNIGSFAGQATGIGGIMGQSNSWNTESQGSSGPAQGGGLGGDAVVMGRGEGVGGEQMILDNGKVFWFGARGSQGGGSTGHTGHLAFKTK